MTETTDPTPVPLLTCGRCHVPKLPSKFWRNKTRASGRDDTCIVCRNAQKKERSAGPAALAEAEARLAELEASGYRDEKGRFIEGHPANPEGRPKGTQGDRWLAVIRETVRWEDIVAIVVTAVAQARRGNRFARDFLFNYAVGKPMQMIKVAGVESPMIAIFAEWLAESSEEKE